VSRQSGREPYNVQEMVKLAKLLSVSSEFTYQFGKAADLNDYSADGTVFDYMSGRRKVSCLYLLF